MWIRLSHYILRNRLANLIGIGFITLLMGLMATRVHMSYEMARMLPASDTVNRVYEDFRKTFGQDGAIVYAAFKGENLCTHEIFRGLYELTEEISGLKGIKDVMSPARVFVLSKDSVKRKFVFKRIPNRPPEEAKETDSLCRQLRGLPFYEGMLFNFKDGIALMAITLNQEVINNRGRVALINDLENRLRTFGQAHHLEVHISGMPYIRTLTTQKVQQELLWFSLGALLVSALLLYYFFRSKKAVIFPLVIVGISVIWALGSIALLGFKITILTGLIPPLLIIIGVENCIFLLNRFHSEFRLHGNKVKALVRVIARTGKANILTNLTTAAGFGAFMVTGNRLLVEFGLIASLNILIIFVLSIILIPSFYSFLPDPQPRHLAHLEQGFSGRLIIRVLHIIQYRRKIVYAIMFVLIAAGLFGISRLTTSGRVVDDIPQKDNLYKDLQFFEQHFHGILPLEIVVDTRKPKGIMRQPVLRQIDKLQRTLETYPELSRSLSIVDVNKFARQAFYNGDPKAYSLPGEYEMAFMLSYLPDRNIGQRSFLKAFTDSSFSKTRISLQMANLSTPEIELLHQKISCDIDSIMPPSKYKVHITGSTLVFTKGTRYLIKNLYQSLLLAFLLITLLLALLFTSWRIILIALIPNLLPQLLTAALMGFAGIPIKPSTILIFSVALGISVDNTIHFLSRYRHNLKVFGRNIRKSVLASLSEAGYSMIYSTAILFFGFGIFAFSGFGGTQAMGLLIPFTLLVALFSNLLLLPSFLLWLDKLVTTPNFEEPMLEILDEEKEEDNEY
jgi:hypothetical protein